MSIHEQDIKEEYFSENELNNPTDGEKALLTNFSCTIDVFDIKKVDVKEEPHEISEEKCEIDEKNVNFNITDFEISCKNELQENLLEECDVEIKCEKEPQIDDCNEYNRTCEDICYKCQIFTYIWHNNGGRGIGDGEWYALPKHLLEIRKSNGAEGIFALQTIPEGIQFGPCHGLERTQRAEGFTWKCKDGNFVNAVKNMEYSHWMQKINCAKVIAEKNLEVFQWEGNLYYRSKCQIAQGIELLWHCGEEHANNFDAGSESYLNPPVEKYVEDMHACTFCNLGFCSQNHLVRHRSMCPYATTSSESQEIVQCTSCKIHLDEKEYSDFHKDRCVEMYSRNSISPMETGRPIKVEVPSTSRDIESDAGGRLDGSDEWLVPIAYESVRSNTSERHNVVHRSTTPYKCEICDKCFPIRSLLKKHLISHSGEKPFACRQCGYRTNRKETLKAHVRSHEGIRPYKCEVCGKSFTQKSILTTHIRIHTGEKPFACHQCDYRSNCKSSLIEHVKIHDGIRPHKCELCNRYFTQKVHLKGHMRVHSDAKPFACGQCDYRGNSNGTLNRHMKTHEGAKPYKCDVCDRYFTRKEILKNHLLIHTDVKPFACDQCDYRTNRKSNLKSHGKMHSDEKLFACHRCDYKSNFKSGLNKHAKTHEDIKPYKCDVCGKDFARQPRLKEHMRVHTGEKPFACHQCDYRCNRKSSLKSHGRIHAVL